MSTIIISIDLGTGIKKLVQRSNAPSFTGLAVEKKRAASRQFFWLGLVHFISIDDERTSIKSVSLTSRGFLPEQVKKVTEERRPTTTNPD